MIRIYPNTKIYIAAPAATFTGGPESLHQLAYHLKNDLNVNAYMYYFPSNHPKPRHPNFEEYGIQFVNQIEDDKDNILVVPEISAGIKLLEHFRHIRKIIWWLSVDNFYLTNVFEPKSNLFIRIRIMINSIYYKFMRQNLFDITEIALKDEKFKRFKLPEHVKKADFHFAQSFYALNFIKSKGITQDKIYYLPDYLNKSFLETQTDLSKKVNIVAYYPMKGFVFTKKIISSAKDIKFVPLINMSRKEVIKILQRAKVYIDFGNHPGRDRIPREAAILGCCVITGKRGSAAFFEDVPIPNEYKFECKKKNIQKIIEKIKDCFENYEERYKDFNYYRGVIKNEPQKFVENLKKIFVKEG